MRAALCEQHRQRKQKHAKAIDHDRDEEEGRW